MFLKKKKINNSNNNSKSNNTNNHKNYNFLDCDWFKKNSYFPPLAKLLSDSLLLNSLLVDSLLSDSSLSQSHSKCSNVRVYMHLLLCFWCLISGRFRGTVALDCSHLSSRYSILIQIFPFFHNLAILLFFEIVIFMINWY